MSSSTTGTASTSATSTSATSTGTGGSGGGPIEGENCINGVDDDGQGGIDCEDPACNGYACVPAPEADWMGPALLYIGAGPLPSCGGSLTVAFDGGTVLAAAAAECDCSCGSPPPAVCSTPPSLERFTAAGCGVPQAQVTPAAPGTCTSVDSVGAASFRSTATVPDVSTCAPSVVSVIPSAYFDTQARLCGGPVGAGCEGGGCFPEPSGDLHEVCIHQSGDLECPAGYPVKHLLFGGFDDSRACGPCNCGAPAGGYCGGVMVIYGDPGCALQGPQISISGMCVDAGTPVGSVIWNAVTNAGECPAGGGAPVGGVTPTQPRTACCRAPP
jgi:hypothetical protein